MADVQVVAASSTTTTTTTTSNQTITDTIELPSLDLPYNYSILINKLEQLALAQLDLTFQNFSDFDELGAGLDDSVANDLELFGQPIASGRAPPPRAAHNRVGLDDKGEYGQVMSDIWIGVILTLLIVSVVFFICSCFLYHKFQQWKNSYRTNQNEQLEICRRCPAEYEVESLPSYTIVSGLPTYDDALEEFRKAGIILTATPIPMMKLFEKDAAKDQTLYTLDSVVCSTGSGASVETLMVPSSSADTISLASVCTCGANTNSTYASSPLTSQLNLNAPAGPTLAPVAIELSPDQLALLSRKRLSLQIAFGQGQMSPKLRRNSRPRLDLYREMVHRNNLLKMSNASGGSPTGSDMPSLHRATSSVSLNTEYSPRRHNSPGPSGQPHSMPYQHRGSLC